MNAPLPRLKLSLSPAAEKHVRVGHPWIYESSVRGQNRDGEAGELAVIYSKNDRFLAVGLFDPHSPLRVRVLQANAPVTVNADFWRQRIDSAIARRAAANLPNPETNAYRLIGGESDGFPALVADVYGGVLVLKIYSAAWFVHLPLLLELLAERLSPQAVVLRLSRNIAALAKAAGLFDGQVIAGDLPSEHVVFLEHGLRFEADVVRGQKTGFFLDQRHNREALRRLVPLGSRVLNTFSFSGGFSLYAAQHAAEVTSVDISAHALAAAERNFALNPALQATHRTVKADVFAWLEQHHGHLWDVVVVDPPSLAKRESERAGAEVAYKKLIKAAIRQIEAGGLLLAASCSAHVFKEDFWELARAAAGESGRPWREISRSAHAPDHHASFSEAEYLKAIFIRFED